MSTGVALAIAGAAAVALFLVERKAMPAAPPVPQSVPTGGSTNVSGFINKVGQGGAAAVANAIGAGPLTPVISKAGGNFVSAEYSGWRQAGSGVTQIAHGNVVSGAKDILVGGAKTAAAPITSTYNTVKSWF